MKLKDICKFVNEKVDTSSFHLEDYVSTENLLPNKGGVTVASKIPQGKATLFKKGDILISNIRPYFKKIYLAKKQGCCSNDVLCIRPNSNIPSSYLYYLLSQDSFFDYVMTGAKGTKMPRGDKGHIMNWPVYQSTLSQQQNIAEILTPLDDKIAVNSRICANLEAQAQALFKSWFVDFTPFKDQPFVDSELGPIPQGWKVGKLGDYVEIKRGGSPRPIQKFLTSQGLNWLKISDATSTQSPFIFNIKEKIIINGLKKTVFLKAGSLVLSNSATPCIPKFLSIDSCIHDGWLYFPHSQLPKNYLYLFFKLMRNNLVSKANGSVFLNLKTDIVKNQVFAFSGEEIYNSFDKIIAPLFKEIENLTYETFQLSALRDTLLPKLMSGEIKL